MFQGIALRIRRLAVVGLVAGGTVALASCGISPRQEVELGGQYAAEINRQLPLVQDAQVNHFVNELGRELARHADRPQIGYTFYVVNIDAVNAFAVPGGYVYVNRGLVERAATLAELAGVLAHEIAHVDLRHGAEQLERQQRTGIGLTALYVLLGRTPGTLERAAVDVGATAVFARYSREAEREADAMAIRYLVAARIDPMGLVTFFGTLLEEQRRQPSMVEQWFSTHPLAEERVAETRRLVMQLPREQLRGVVVNTAAFDAAKARLRRYPAPPRQFRAH